MQLVDKYRPKRLADFVGVDRPRAILQHFAKHPYGSAWLLLGPSGLGKTTMALALANEIGGQVHHIPAAKCTVDNVDIVARQCWNRPLVGDFNIVVADEADRMSPQARYSFLSILDITAMPPDTIFLFTANGVDNLREAGQGGEGRFLSRVRTVKFNTDSVLEPGAELLARIWKAEHGGKPAPDFQAIMREAGLNVRSAIMALELELMAGADPEPRKPTPAVVPTPSAAKTTTKPPGGAEELIDAHELARAKGVYVATIYRHLQLGRLPEPATRKPLAWRRSEVLAA